MLNINKPNIKGNNNIVIQINGEIIEKSWNEVITSFVESLQKQIDILKNNLEDKKKIVDLLDKEVIELSGKIELLEKEKKILEEQVTVILNTLNGKDLSKTNKLYEQAYKYFIEGDIEQALEVLDDAKIEEQKKAVAETRILKARMLVIEYIFDEAGKNYEKALNHFTDWESSLEAGNFFIFLNDFQKANNYYQISLKEAKTDIEKINSLNNLALINNNLKDSDNLLDEALQLSDNLNKNASIEELSTLGMILNNNGKSWYEKNDFAKAEIYYQKALNIRRQLAKNIPEKYLYQVFETVSNLGLVKEKQKDYKQAKIYFVEALKIAKKLSKSEPQKYLLIVATTQNNIATFEKKNGNIDIANDLYYKSIETFEKLPKSLQEIYKSFPADVFHNLGILQKNNEKDYPKAELSFKTALIARRELAQKNPYKYYPYVAETLHSIGNNYAFKEDLIEAENHLSEALDIKKKLADQKPEAFDITLANTYRYLGELYSSSKLDNEQLFQKYLSKSIELYDKYSDKSQEAKNWGKVAKDILADWKKEWLENFDKVIDETFDEYDEVFKALA